MSILSSLCGNSFLQAHIPLAHTGYMDEAHDGTPNTKEKQGGADRPRPLLSDFGCRHGSRSLVAQADSADTNRDAWILGVAHGAH